MSRSQRFLLIAVAAVVAVGAFIALRPADDDESEPVPAATATTPAEAGGSETTPAPAPTTQRIRIRGGEPVGGKAEIVAEKGETVRFVVTSDAPHTVHLHGYDIAKAVAPGEPARYRFEASIEGIFEVELEDTGTPIAELRVEP